jgi:methylase of polypeptide subunit release factors
MTEPTPAILRPKPQVRWLESESLHVAHWRSESGAAPPKRIVIADDTLRSDTAWRMACEGTAILWRGDFQNARQLLQAIARRCDRNPRKRGSTPTEEFNLHRQAQAHRARILGMLLVCIEAGHMISLKRAPSVVEACSEAHGAAAEPYVCSLRELQAIIGAYEWRKKGVYIPALGAKIYPHYGVFSPVRGEYLDLVAAADLPARAKRAFDVGTGTGVVAAILARRGVQEIVASDLDDRALHCAQDNIRRLGLDASVQIVRADLFPEGKADLIVCNPPWLPARPTSPIEHAIYDPGSRMLNGYLKGLAERLNPGGEGWLILSDLAVHLELRAPDAVENAIKAAGLIVMGRTDTAPTHAQARDPDDPLYEARAKERTSLWRLGIASARA